MAAMTWARGLAPALFLALPGTPAGARDLPDVAEVVAKADAKCLELWGGFQQVVATEQDVQRVFSKSGKTQRERRIRSDYYIVRAPSSRADDPEGLLEFRDVLEVDGKRIRRDPGRLAAMMAARGRNVQEEVCRLLSTSNEHNLLMGSGLLINFAAGLAGYIHVDPKVPTTYRLAPEKVSAEDELVVCLQEGAKASRALQGSCMKPNPLPGSGCVTLSRDDASIRRAEVTVTLGAGPLQLRMISEYGPGPGGLRVPLRRTLQMLHPKWRDGMAGQAEAVYSNFRRFTAESTVAFEPIR